MNKLANMRHWSERMSPNFGISRGPNNMGMPGVGPHPKVTSQGAAPITAPQVADTPIHYSLQRSVRLRPCGPNTEDILHATTDASSCGGRTREDAADDVPVFELPVHAQNLALLCKLCKDITQSPLCHRGSCHLDQPQARPRTGHHRVSLGCSELVHKTRETIFLNDTPLALLGSPACVEARPWCGC